MTDRLLTLLGFAAKSGNLSFGAAATLQSLQRQKAELVLIGSDLSEKSRKEAHFHAEKNGVTAVDLTGYDSKTLSDAVGRNCGILAVNEKQFAKSLLETVNRGGNADDK